MEQEQKPPNGRRALAQFEDIPEGESLRVRVDNRYLALFKVEGRIYALNALCPHAGAFLDMGWLDGHKVFCPMHGWDFDVRTGESEAFGARTPCYPVEVEDGTVYLKEEAPPCGP